MFKAVKECMRNWVMTHKRLYWYIVIGIAALAFGIISGMGCAKLEKANAAEETLKVNWKGNEVYLPLGNWPYYIVIKDGNGSGSDYVFVSYDKLVAKYDSPYACISLVDELGNVVQSGQKVRVYGFDVSKTDFMQSYSDGYSYAIAKSFPSASKVISNYDVIRIDTGEVLYESFIGYSSDSAYVKFDSLSIDNKLAQGISTLNDKDLYTDWFSTSTWQYNGRLMDISALDLSYKLNLKFTVELPTAEYIDNLYETAGYRSDLGAVILRRNKELVEYWYRDTTVKPRVYEVDYTIDIVPDENGAFSYSFNFAQWEYLLRACDEELNTECLEYEASGRAVLFSFMHVKDIRSEVITTREDCVVYGGFTTNRFERGVYGSCAEAYTKVDKDFVTSDLLEDMIDDDISVAEREYLKELEGRIEELEGQLGGMTSADNAFGDLEGSDLWTGFQSLVSGLASLAPSIRALSTLTGAVFAFMPLTVTGIMSTTLFAICIIAIIKAIRG